DRAEPQCGEECDAVLRTVHAPDEDAVALLEPALLQIPRDARHDLIQIAVRPLARPEPGPDRQRVLGAELPSRLLKNVVECLHPSPLARESAKRLPGTLPV